MYFSNNLGFDQLDFDMYSTEVISQKNQWNYHLVKQSQYDNLKSCISSLKSGIPNKTKIK